MSCALVSVALSGQEVVWERTGQADQTLIGVKYAKLIGDIDGDRFDDLVMLALRMPRWTQELWLLSGRDGRTLRTQQIPPGPTFFDDYGAAGDMDGDGTPDYVFTAWENGSPWLDHVQVRSGRDGSLILHLLNPSELPQAPGASVLGGRDLTGDGRPDLVLVWQNGQVGIVGAFDHTGRRLYYHDGIALTLGVEPGNSLGWVGDIDGDGADDFTLGSYDRSLGRYVALVLSGRTGLVLVRGLGANPSLFFGECADGCGDIDMDGVPDFAASGAGQMQVFSGRTGQTIRSWVNVGSVMRGGGFDFDRDGVPDLVFSGCTQCTYPGGDFGIRMWSGRDSEWIGRVLFCRGQGGTSRSCAWGGSAIDTGQPQPGNPYPVFVFAEPFYGYNTNTGDPLGRVRMYRGTPDGVEPYGTACTGTLPSRPQMGIRDLQGRGVRLHLSNAPPGAHVALLLGFSRTQWHGLSLPASLASIGLLDCSLYTSIDLFAKTWTGTAGLDRGYAAIDLPLPLKAPGQDLFTLHGQWLVLDPTNGGVALSDAVLWRH